MIGRGLRPPARGDKNTEAQISQMAAAQFLDVLKKKQIKLNKMQLLSLIITCLSVSNYAKTIILLRLSGYCRMIPSNWSRGLLDNIHLAFRLVNNC